MYFKNKELQNYSKTARVCNVSRKCVRSVVQRLSKKTCATHAPGEPVRRGRQPALSQDAAVMALEMLIDKKSNGAQQVASTLKDQGIVSDLVHKSTVIRHARRAAVATGQKLVVRRGPPPKGLTKATMTKRLYFAKSNSSRAWGATMFTDRKKFLLRYPGTAVKMVRWELARDAGQVEEGVYQPNRPQVVNIYAGITKFGVTAVHVVAGTSKHKTSYKNKKGQGAKNITQHEYESVLSKTLLPEGRRIFSTQGVSSWVLQQDNDPAHKLAEQVVAQWNQKNAASVGLLKNWPPNSPDLNIIENVWGYVEARVNEKGCKDFDGFREEVLKQFSMVPQSMLKNLYKSMPKRLQLVIENEGHKIKY